MVLWGAVAEVAVFAVNATTWATFDRRRACDRRRGGEGRRQRELPTLARAEDEAAVAELRKRGVTVTRLTASGRAAFAFAARSVYDKWAAVAGADLVGAADATRRRLKAATP